MRASELAALIPGATLHGDEYHACCPAHDDQTPSLTFQDGEDRILIHCHAGCRPEAVMQALNLTMRDLFFDAPASPRMNGQSQPGRIVATYDYRDEAGVLRYQVLRSDPKGFRQRRPDGNGGWIYNLTGVRRVCYRLPDIQHAPQVFVVEGEKDVARLRSENVLATCNSGGADKWTDDHTAQLVAAGGPGVVILPDNDEPGRKHAESVAHSCVAAGLSVKIVELPNLPVKGDVSDYFDAGGTVESLLALVDMQPEWTLPPPSDALSCSAQNGNDVLRYTDLGNAELFARQHCDSARYCQSDGSWFVFDATTGLWTSNHAAVMQKAKASVLSLYDDARAESDDDRRAKIASHAVKSESAQRLQAMILLSSSEPGMTISHTAFDADPWLFSVANGMLDLRTGILRERRRDDFVAKCAPVSFDPTAECPAFLQFLNRIFAHDERVIRYVQQIIGYCLTGVTVEQALFILWGSGSNGKSTLIKVLLQLVGDYGIVVPADTFFIRAQDGRARPDLVRLKGTRLAAAIETDDGCRLSESTVKQMTGGDTIVARGMYKDYIEFQPTHKILLATNHKPRIQDNSHAMWRRLKLLPFEVQIPDTEQDKTLGARLLSELSGILNWALAGCRDYQQAGRLEAPEPVTAATASYRTEQDVLDEFLRDRCVRGSGENVKFADLRKEYCAWADTLSDRALGSKSFAAALQERGFEPLLIKNARHYRGLRLRTMGDEIVEAEACATIQGGIDVDLDS